MEAKELRIGNLFNPENPLMVEAWMLLPESKVDFKPIPITERWLNDFGFTNSEMNKALYRGYGKLFYYNEEDHDVSYIVNGEFVTTLKYVHQLQNLYFSITGCDLQIKTTSSPCRS